MGKVIGELSVSQYFSVFLSASFLRIFSATSIWITVSQDNFELIFLCAHIGVTFVIIAIVYLYFTFVFILNCLYSCVYCCICLCIIVQEFISSTPLFVFSGPYYRSL